MNHARWRHRLVFVLLLASCARNPVVGTPAQERPRAKDDHDGRYLAYRLRQEGCAPDQAKGCCGDFRKRFEEANQQGDGARAARALQVLAMACPDLRKHALEVAAAHATPNPDKPPPLRLRWAARLDPSDRIVWAGAFVDGRYQPGGDIPPGVHTLQVEMHVVSTSTSEESVIYQVLAQEQVTLLADDSRTYVAQLEKQPQAAGNERFSLTVKEGRFLPPPPPRLAEFMKTSSKPPPTLVVGRRQSYQEPRLPREFSGHNRWRGLVMVCVDIAGTPEGVMPMNPAPHPRLMGVIVDSFLHARFAPTTFEGAPITRCHPVNFELS